jgi:hypothetical protein
VCILFRGRIRPKIGKRRRDNRERKGKRERKTII